MASNLYDDSVHSAFIFEPIFIPIIMIASLITFLARLVRCPCGQDLIYSCMEVFELMDRCIGVYWEVKYWREHERRVNGVIVEV